MDNLRDLGTFKSSQGDQQLPQESTAVINSYES